MCNNNQDYNRQPPDSNYIVDLKKAREQWKRGFSSIEELFSTETVLPDGNSKRVPTHTLGKTEGEFRIISYTASKQKQIPNEAKQPDIARFVSPGEFAISIKHHCPNPILLKKYPLEKLKLQCQHIQVAVGITLPDKKTAGVITINQPQKYHLNSDNYRKDRKPLRLFGNADYPIIFIKPRFPEGYFTSAQKKAYVDNIRTWIIIANTLTHFPDDGLYDGRDVIATYTVERIQLLGRKLLKALAGQRSAKDWLRASKNKLYCSEFVHAALNLGIHIPLNQTTLDKIDKSLYPKVCEALKNKKFVKTKNDNFFARWVDLQMAPENLKPITKILRCDPYTEFHPELMPDARLATRLYTWADILLSYIENVMYKQGKKVAIPPEEIAYLDSLKREFLKLYWINRTRKTNPWRQEFNRIYDAILAVAGKKHADTHTFKESLKPFITQLRWLACKHPKAVDYIITPDCYLRAASEENTGSLLEWQYLGHALHESLLISKEKVVE